MRFLFILILLCAGVFARAQQRIEMRDSTNGAPIANASIVIGGKGFRGSEKGNLLLIESHEGEVRVSAAGYQPAAGMLVKTDSILIIRMIRNEGNLDAVVVSGTMRAVARSASPVAVEIYSPKFFMKNPTASLFDALQLVNGVRPQLNCNICNTGDIHINGLEGAYTTILIDGMPIVSSLASVYGLMGIPNSMIERVEIVKGPASSLYGAEAIGGLINVITKDPLKAPVFSLDLMGNSWSEFNLDIAGRYKIGQNIHGLSSVNYYGYGQPKDLNGDNFTDITLQQRASIFNKYTFIRKEAREASMAFRYMYEDRWGGEMNWEKRFRGTDSVYGEQATTARIEVIGKYQLPLKERLLFSYSMNSHEQRSAYGTMLFDASQRIVFGQLVWDKVFNEKLNLLTGITARHRYYDDNTPATFDSISSKTVPEKYWQPGIFVQNEWKPRNGHNLLVGVRYDYDPRHGAIFTPRFAYKISLPNQDIVRFNAGSGFRVVNIFTEDHAALTGARTVRLKDRIRPERSFNMNINYVKNISLNNGWVNLDLTAWLTRFSNKIIPDYSTHPDQIIYSNLNGYAISRGMTVNSEWAAGSRFRMNLGASLIDLYSIDGSENKKTKTRQLLSEPWTASWTLSYQFKELTIDYSGNIYGPMLLPLLSDLDPRDARSPVWSIQNIQVTKNFDTGISFYGGIKNLLDFRPYRRSPFMIARAHDPFDKQVQFDSQGSPVANAENPYGLSFDPSYAYAPNQGIRLFFGMRWNLARK